MRSSISPHASFSPWLLAALYAGIIGTPLLWLTALQTGYVLAYQACDARSTAWVVVPTLGATAIVVGLTAVAWRGHQRAKHGRLPLPMMGVIAVGMAVLMVVVMIASAIAPIMLNPCD
jgi:hypothetical protein